MQVLLLLQWIRRRSLDADRFACGVTVFSMAISCGGFDLLDHCFIVMPSSMLFSQVHCFGARWLSPQARIPQARTLL